MAGVACQAVEPRIGHTKTDHRLDRCWLQGAMGDALHALSCSAGYNISWLLRAIAISAWAGFFTPSRQRSRALPACCKPCRHGQKQWNRSEHGSANRRTIYQRGHLPRSDEFCRADELGVP